MTEVLQANHQKLSGMPSHCIRDVRRLNLFYEAKQLTAAEGGGTFWDGDFGFGLPNSLAFLQILFFFFFFSVCGRSFVMFWLLPMSFIWSFSTKTAPAEATWTNCKAKRPWRRRRAPWRPSDQQAERLELFEEPHGIVTTYIFETKLFDVTWLTYSSQIFETVYSKTVWCLEHISLYKLMCFEIFWNMFFWRRFGGLRRKCARAGKSAADPGGRKHRFLVLLGC